MKVMQNFISIPSVIERQNRPITQLTASLDKRIQLFEAGAGYLVGDLALAQGLAPYRNINSSPASIDYQLLAKAGLLVASGAKSGELVVTIGFPTAVFDLYRQQAEDFFALRDVMIEYQADTINSVEKGRVQLTISHLEITSEILGCINGLRKGPAADTENFFIVSLGYGTCETALSTTTGPVARTCMSAPGLRHAVNNLYQELSGSYYLGMKNEHMINQGFQKGQIVIERKRKDLMGMRKTHLAGYYEEILSPTLRKAFTDTDYEQAGKLYLVGGGALYPELLEMFQREFDGILDIIIPEEAGNMAALGYFHRSAQWCGPTNSQKAVGLDIGNAYTVVATASVPKAKATPVAANGQPESIPAEMLTK